MIKTNTNPVFGLFEDRNLVVTDICRKMARRAPSPAARDRKGTFHKLCVVSDRCIIRTIEKYFDVHPSKDFQKLSKKEIQPIIMVFKDGKYRILTTKKEAFLKKAMPCKSKAYRNLAVSALHYVAYTGHQCFGIHLCRKR